MAQRWCERWPEDPKTGKNISYWEVWPAASGHAPSLEVLARLAELYRCSVGDLLADLPSHREPGRRPGGGAQEAARPGASLIQRQDSIGMRGVEDVRRRTVMKAVAGIGIASALGAAGPPPTMIRGADHWRETVWEYGFAYFTRPRDGLLDDLVADFGELKAEMTTYQTDSPVLRSLAESASMLAALMAKSCTDLGDVREARDSWRAAKAISDLSMNPDIQLWVRGNECMSGLYGQRPMPVIQDLIDKALSIRGPAPSGGRATLFGIKAQAFSLAGRRVDAESALQQGRREFETLPPAVTGAGDSVFGWPEQDLRHCESFTLTHIGETDRAQEAQNRALELYPHEQSVSRSQIELHRAMCVIQDGAVTDGLHHAGTAFQAVPVQRRKRLLLTIAEQVLDTIPEGAGRGAPARDFRDLVAASSA